MKATLFAIVLAVAVAAAAPASAGGWTEEGCRVGDTWVPVALGHPDDANQDLAVCERRDGSTYDNRLPKDGGGGGGWADDGCRVGDTWVAVSPGHPDDANEDLAVCERSDGSTYDNRLPKDGGGGGGWTEEGCRVGDTWVAVSPGDPDDANGDLAVCRRDDGSTYDNRLR